MTTVALPANGSRQKTTSRARSEPIIRPRRERRSTSGPSSRPTRIIGRNSAMRSALTHVPEPVRS
jgi:hypothetical protein